MEFFQLGAKRVVFKYLHF